MIGRLLVITFLALPGCSSTTTNTGGSGGAGASGASGSGGSAGGGGSNTGGTAGCAQTAQLCAQDPSECCQCTSAKCPTELSACLCDNPCVEALQCGFKCSDTVCVEACGKGNALFAALRNCSAAGCGTQCQ